MPLTTLSLKSGPDAFQALMRLPKISPMTARLLKLLARDCGVPELTLLVEKDAPLSASVLQLANSAVFARLQPIHSLQHAISMVGLGTIRRFALAVSISNLFSRFKAPVTFSLGRFNAHSVATGIMTELLSAELPVQFPEEAFLAGMLHDVGKLLIATNLPKKYDEILELNALLQAPLTQCEQEVLNVDHAELSALAIKQWDLARPIELAARFHHDPDRAWAEEKTPAGKVGLSLVVHRADAFVNYCGLSVLPPALTPAEAPSLEFEGFAVPVDRVLTRFEKEWKDLGDLFR